MEIINILSEINKKIEQMQNEDQFGNYFFCFRGESKDYGSTRLTPTLFRENDIINNLPDEELINLISDYKIVENKELSNLSKAIEGQHFLELSRLLDITFSILPAIYFASSSNEKENGVVYIFRFPEAFSPSSSYINSYFDNIIERKTIPYNQNFRVLSHTQSNERIKSQSGGFILFPGNTMKNIPKLYYESVEISHDTKKILLEELDSYFGINEAVLYPEKDKKKEIIKKGLKKISGDKVNIKDDFSFYEIEIKSALARLEYEINRIDNQKSSIVSTNNVYKKRFLRKAVSDIKAYLKSIQTLESSDYEKLSSLIKYEAKLIEYTI